jgi:DNA-binding CsgD family transcriptional regulator/sugar lactone lactonase YvrE
MEELEEYHEKLKTLTDRQLQVLHLVCHSGATYQQVATELDISERTVIEHMTNIYMRLDIAERNRAERQRIIGKLCTFIEEIQPSDVEEPENVTGGTPTTASADGEMAYLVPLLRSVLEDEPTPLVFQPAPLVVRVTGPSAPGTYESHPRRPLILVLGVALGMLLTLLFMWNRMFVAPQNVATPEDVTKTQDFQELTKPNPLTVATPPSNTVLANTFGCGTLAPLLDENRFLAQEGVTNFTQANSDGIVLSDKVRTLTIDYRGLWVGYFANGSQTGGVGFHDKQNWTSCALPDAVGAINVNALLTDPQGHLWVATEQSGIFVQRDTDWEHFTTADGLPSDEIYGLTLDAAGAVWASTWKGIAKYDGVRWSVPYSAENRTLFSDHTHTVAFTTDGYIWVGHISEGVSYCCTPAGEWVHYTAESDTIGGNNIRDILVRPESTGDQSIWVATQDGGVSRYYQEQWTTYRETDGLPSLMTNDLAIDRYGRVWVATAEGVGYFDGQRWQVYHRIPALALAIGPSCSRCPFDDDHVWTGTVQQGITHSRLPLPEAVVEIIEVCFETKTRDRICPELQPSITEDKISAVYPIPLAVGEVLIPRITVMPLPGHQLVQDRGDMLVNLDPEDMTRYGIFGHIAVEGTAESGQPYTFVDRDRPLIMTASSINLDSQPHAVQWRTWYFTRFVGPIIQIQFTVHN